jgi:CBS domain-containing protein
MSTLAEILKAKSGMKVRSVSPTQTVMQAVALMNDYGIGALVVEHRGQMAGIFTERDILRRVLAEGRNPDKTLVLDVMTADVVSCSPETLIADVRSLMRDRRIRHVPVVDESGNIAGIVSIGDLNAYISDSQESTIHSLHEYLHGRS